MTRRRQIEEFLKQLSVYKFRSIDNQIAYVLGESAKACKDRLKKETLLDLTMEGERKGFLIAEYILKRCLEIDIAFAFASPIVLHNEILPF